LQAQIDQLEQRLKTCTTASDAQQRAERRVCELTEEKQHMMKMNDELTQRIALLQAEFNVMQVRYSIHVVV
jgi:prefoldin subunit 5